MATTLVNAYSIHVDESTKAELRNIHAGIMENIAKNSLSGQLKSRAANLREKAGSYEFKRFANVGIQDYGTSRAKRAGEKNVVPPVQVLVDKRKEIVYEVTADDVQSFGEGYTLADWARENRTRFESAWSRYYDREFFSVAKSQGTQAKIGGTFVEIDLSDTKAVKIRTQLEKVIQMAVKTQNDFVDGIDRELLTLVLNSDVYGDVKDELDDNRNFMGSVSDKNFKGINGVPCLDSTRLPAGVAFILLTPDTIAQPIVNMLPDSDPFSMEKIEMSADYAFGMFNRHGTKVLAPDLVWWGAVKA